MSHIQEPYLSLLRRLVRCLKRRFPEELVTVAVYGSVSRGDAKPDSDVDILVIVEGLPKGLTQRQRLFLEVEKELEPLYDSLARKGYNPFVSPILKTPEEAKHFSLLYLDMLQDAVLLYDRGSFFKDVLRRVGERLRHLKAKKVRLGSGWYWILKPDAKPGELIELDQL